jgi:hypothetical protein
MAARREAVMIATAGKVKEVETSAIAKAGEFRPTRELLIGEKAAA